MTDQEIDGVVAGLGPPDKAAIRDELFSLRSGVSRVRSRLIRKGLMHVSGMLTPDGEAVRTRLMEADRGDR